MTDQPEGAHATYLLRATLVPRPGCRFTTLTGTTDLVATYGDPDDITTLNTDDEHTSYEGMTPDQIADSIANFARHQEDPSDRLWMLAGLDPWQPTPADTTGESRIDQAIRDLQHEALHNTPDDEATRNLLNNPQLVQDYISRLNAAGINPCPADCDITDAHQHLDPDNPFLNVLHSDGNVANCTTHNMGDCPHHKDTSNPRPTETTAQQLASALGTATLTVGRLLQAVKDGDYANTNLHAMTISMTLARYSVLSTRLLDEHPDLAIKLDAW